MEKIERVQIFIDGGNFHHLVLKKLGIQELNFSFEEFSQFLGNGRTITPLGKRYYVGTVREQAGNPRSKEAMSRQTKFFTILNSYHWEIKTSKLRIRNEKIIIDHRVHNYQELHSKGIRVIEYTTMREKGIDVKLATDNTKDHTRPLQTMINRSDIQRILVESDIKKFEKQFLQNKPQG